MRKSPVRHTRSAHTRKGKSVRSSQVGNGSAVNPTFKYPKGYDDDFTDDKGLDYSISVIVPSTQDVDGKISSKAFKSRVMKVKKELNSLYGGSTTVTAKGSYESDSGKFVNEKVFVVTAHADKNHFNKGRTGLNTYVKSIKKDWGQESIGVTLESPKSPSKTFHFV